MNKIPTILETFSDEFYERKQGVLFQISLNCFLVGQNKSALVITMFYGAWWTTVHSCELATGQHRNRWEIWVGYARLSATDLSLAMEPLPCAHGWPTVLPTAPLVDRSSNNTSCDWDGDTIWMPLLSRHFQAVASLPGLTSVDGLMQRDALALEFTPLCIKPSNSSAWVQKPTQIAKIMGPTWGPPGSCRPQMGPMLAPWTLLLGYSCYWRWPPWHGAVWQRWWTALY